MNTLIPLNTCIRSPKRALNTYSPILYKLSLIILGGLILSQSSLVFAQSTAVNKQSLLTLEKATELALKNDDWLVKSELSQSRLEVLSEGANTLPDPTFSLGLLNLPTDGFAFNQEPMTQVKVGATQLFPRGDSLALEEKKLKLSALEQPHLRDERRLNLTLQTTHLWLDAFEASASHKLVNNARPLFDKLGDIVSASYASSVGKAKQQDIIRAELELVRLNDRLITLDTSKRVALSKLSKYLFSRNNAVAYSKMYNNQPTLPLRLTEIPKGKPEGFAAISNASTQALYRLVETHPLIHAAEQRIQASSIDIELAEQAYKPQYAVNASYALRDDAPSGQSRADFISVGASVSLPLFSDKRQDANVAGAKLMTEAMRTEKLIIMRELMAGLSSAYQDYVGLSERLAVYQNTILPQMAQQSQAALNAYTNDTGDFAEVVRAKIAELDAEITQLNIEVSKRKALANIRYFSPEILLGDITVNGSDTRIEAIATSANKEPQHD